MKSSTSPTSHASGKSKVVLEAERQAYLRDANDQMKKYHETRELMRQGKLKNINSHRGPKHANRAQAGVAAVFLALFIGMPFLGRKIARDDAFRERWVPAWYDYTVQKPERPWTREELHEQRVQVYKILHERAIAGEFAPEKLEEMKSKLQEQGGESTDGKSGANRSTTPQAWDTFQPALGKEEEYNESE